MILPFSGVTENINWLTPAKGFWRSDIGPQAGITTTFQILGLKLDPTKCYKTITSGFRLSRILGPPRCWGCDSGVTYTPALWGPGRKRAQNLTDSKYVCIQLGPKPYFAGGATYFPLRYWAVRVYFEPLLMLPQYKEITSTTEHLSVV
ncbi:hypothetical protein TNCV_3060931 [Trichonephila clavipes]|nr:hypothetical protein TNCV_3060931 [Trichonephila clavipes]